jgi:hypothetical protein
VLTPAANQPAITGYGLPNPLKFGFVAPNSTSGAVTLEILALGFLPVYVPAGSQATSGTLLSGQYYEVTYTTGVNYNSGAGAWVLSSYQPATGVTAVANPAVSGLKIINNAGVPSTKIDVSFVSACLVSGLGAPIFTEGGSFTIDLTVGTVTSTANGMDGESRPAGGWVYIYAISTGTGSAGLASLNSTLGGTFTFPAGYAYYAYLGAMFCDGSSNLLRTQQKGCDSQYVVTGSSNTATLPVMAGGVAGTYSATSPTLAAVSITTVVPPTASIINMMITNAWKGGTNSNVLIAPNNSYGGANNGPTGSNGLMWPFNEDIGSPTSWFAPMGLESSNIYWASSAAGAAIGCLGWVDYCSAAGG